MRIVTPPAASGPLAETVMDQLVSWLGAEGYAPSMVPQILGAARELSVWMSDNASVSMALTAVSRPPSRRPIRREFEAVYPPGVPSDHGVAAWRADLVVPDADAG